MVSILDVVHRIALEHGLQCLSKTDYHSEDYSNMGVFDTLAGSAIGGVLRMLSSHERLSNSSEKQGELETLFNILQQLNAKGMLRWRETFTAIVYQMPI